MNPLLDFDTYIPDVEAHVFGDNLYLYGSHDKKGGNRFCMLGYEVFYSSIKDLKTFKSDGISFSKNEDIVHRLNKDIEVDYYAPDCVKGNDGNYYLFYSAMGPNTKPFGPISVAKSSSPTGPFKYYGDIKYKSGEKVIKFLNNDPAVLNDNGRIYLYYGWGLGRDFRNKLLKPLYNFVLSKLTQRPYREVRDTYPSIMSCAFVELDPNDMLTALDEPKSVLDSKTTAKKGTELYDHPFYEAPSIRKFGDYYYLIYSSGVNGELCYAKSKFPDRDFEYGGVLISNADIGYKGNKIAKDIYGTNHGSIEKVGDGYVIFYHRLTNQSDFQRHCCAERIYMDEKCDFKQVEMTSNGLSDYLGKGVVSAARASSIYNENTGAKLGNLSKKRNAPYLTFDENNHYITNITGKSCISFKYFCLHDLKQISLKYRGKGNCDIMLRMNGKNICSSNASSLGDWSILSFELRDYSFEKTDITFIFETDGKFDLLEMEIK